MFRRSLGAYYAVGSVIALLLAITGAAGVFDNGMYAPFLAETTVAFQRVQDLVSLLFSPMLVAMMLLTSRGSQRAFVIWAGLMVFVAYYYAFYGFGYVYTRYYLLYLALMGLSLYSLIGLLTSVDQDALRASVREKMPVRLVALILGMTVLFVPIWVGMIMQRIAAQQVQETDLVFVFDLPYLIPACVYTAVQVWQRRNIGYLLAGPLLFKATVSGMLLTGGEVLKMQRGLAPALDQLSMYLFLAIVGLTGLVLYLRNLDDHDAQPLVDAAAHESFERGV